MSLEDAVWDAMAAADDVKVRALHADSASVTYKVSFTITLSHEQRQELGKKADERGQRVISLLRCAAAKGLRLYLAADDAPDSEARRHEAMAD